MNTLLEPEIHEKEPEGFSPLIHVAACYLEREGKLLLLQRASDCRIEPNQWTVPSGKFEEGETPKEAGLRELAEETGIFLEKPDQIQPLGMVYVRNSRSDFTYHLFKVQLDHTPPVRLSHEHQSYRWASPKDLEELPLMSGAKGLLNYYRAALKKKRPGASVNVYLILKQNDKVLLQLRKNTGYCDGLWSLPAGHVEEGESATEAMIREAREEIGIELSPSQIQVAHVMHRKTNRVNVDLFFTCHSWQGTIQNCENEKCGGIEYFSTLPPNVIDYIQAALKYVSKGTCYSELGFEGF